MSKVETKEAEKTATKKPIVIDERVVAMAEIIKKDLTIEKDGTVIIKEGVYIDCLPASITKELDEEHRVFRETFAAAAGLAVGTGSVKAFKANKELEEISATFPTSGRDKLTIQAKREVSTVNPKDRTQTFQNYGVIRAVNHTSYGDKDTGMFGSVAKSVKESAAAALRDL
jgi:hypothetical protein